MDKLYKFNKYLYVVLRISIIMDIFSRTKENILSVIIYLGLFVFIIINDHFRWKSFYKNIKYFYISFLISMILGFYLNFRIEGYTYIYLFVIVYELILHTEGPISKKFIILQLGLMIGLFIINIYRYADMSLVDFFQENILEIIMYFLSISFYCLILFMYKSLNKEKRKVEKLNKELNLSYNKLKDQSDEIEKLTIARERNRLAGEIHDNLGHGLVALNMNLDVAEKIIDKDVGRAKELIEKSLNLTKESMDNLRKAVYALKEEGTKGFIESIRKIAEDIESSGDIKVFLNIGGESESLALEYKEIIYSTIKEAITNSIKHGKADKITIEIKVEDQIKLTIKDNGLGCKDLTKGNGLLAMENRVNIYNGKIAFSYGHNEGFKISIYLAM